MTEEFRNYHFGDTIYEGTSYEYDQNGNKIKTIYKPGYYLEKFYDSGKKLISFKQVYKDKSRWEYNYSYTDATRIGRLQDTTAIMR